MDPPPYRRRPGDDLVEPLFAALGEDQEEDGTSQRGGEEAPEDSSQMRRRTRLGAVFLAGGLLALASFWESIRIWLSAE